jgi:hypothetical protein
MISFALPSRGNGNVCTRLVFSVLIPLTLALVTIVISISMIGLSAEEASESRRFERENIWDIPVMDSLRLWKRSMGSIGSGKLRFEEAFINGEEQVR